MIGLPYVQRPIGHLGPKKRKEYWPQRMKGEGPRPFSMYQGDERASQAAAGAGNPQRRSPHARGRQLYPCKCDMLLIWCFER